MWNKPTLTPAILFSVVLLQCLTVVAASAGEVPFAGQAVLSSTPTEPIGMFTADIDRDGLDDLLVASRLDDSIRWYRNSGGHLFLPVVISSIAGGAHGVHAADLDGDGDLDVLSASPDDDKLAWYENTDGSGSFGPQTLISGVRDGARGVVAADIDGDGDADVVAASSNDDTVIWYENSDGAGTFVAQAALTTSFDYANDVAVADIDRDGDLDVVASARNAERVAWFENTNGGGSFGSARLISNDVGRLQAIAVADMDNDGDPDVLTTGFGDEITFHRNIDESLDGEFAAKVVLTTLVDTGWDVSVGDLDQDGDLDVMSASADDDKIAWYENLGGGNFGAQQVITTMIDVGRQVGAIDLDADGDLDVVSVARYDNKIAWYENQTIHRRGHFLAPDGVLDDRAREPRSVFAADIDGDGYGDIVAGVGSAMPTASLFWYRNADGKGRFERMEANTEIGDVGSVVAADLDNDGDADLLAGMATGGTIFWHENVDGRGAFGPKLVVREGVSYPESVFAADLDHDGDQDVLAAFLTPGEIAWFKNLDGLGNFGPAQTISIDVEFPQSVFAADLDGDGDADVLSASQGDDKVAWYENSNGNFADQQIIGAGSPGAHAVFAADIDGDGDVDVLSADSGDNRVAWFENVDGAGAFGAKQTISTQYPSPKSVFAGDLDCDGDLDVLARHSTLVALYEHLDGAGSFAPAQLINTDLQGGSSVFAADLDGDCDLDVVAASELDERVDWYRNHGGAQPFRYVQIVPTNAIDATTIETSDLDGDGDLDVLTTSRGDNKVVWHENLDGAGSFAFQSVIAFDANDVRSALATDVDGDSNPDVITTTFDGVFWYRNDGAGSFGSAQFVDGIAFNSIISPADVDGDADMDVVYSAGTDTQWHANTDGLGNFAPGALIDDMADASSIAAVRIDGDADLDILVSAPYPPIVQLAWYDNVDGTGTFGPAQVIDLEAGFNVVATADVDGDGDTDVISGGANSYIAWHENTDGQGHFGAETEISPWTIATSTESLSAADIDGDGDPDLLAAIGADGTVREPGLAWFENLDDSADFGAEQIILSTEDPGSILVADLDGDGDPDALSATSVGPYAEGKIAWYPNVRGQVTLTSVSRAPAYLFEGEQGTVLEISVTHEGRAGDLALELASLTLRLAEPASSLGLPGNPLTSAEADTLMSLLSIYRDDGSGAFEPGSDSLAATSSPVTPFGGLISFVFNDNDPDVRVESGQTALLFVVVDIAPGGSAVAPNTFTVTHLVASDSVEYAGSAIALERMAGDSRIVRPIAVYSPTEDQDSDGLSNIDERDLYGTDPLSSDSDADGLSDGTEVGLGTDPLSEDTDEDGLADRDELNLGTDPLIGDTDNDGVLDGSDNCLLTANADQRDTNGEGIGNACDADISNNCFVSFDDLSPLKAAFFPNPYNPDADFDGDGFVNFGDLAFLKATFFASDNPGPGPSAPGNGCY